MNTDPVNVRRITTNFSAQREDSILLVDASSGNLTGRLFALQGWPQTLVIFQTGATTNTVTLLSPSGSTVYPLSGQNASVTLRQDDIGTWRAVGATFAQDLSSTGSPTFAGLTLNGDPSTSIQVKRNSVQFDKSNATLANITGLSAPVQAGGVYSFRAVLHINNGSGLNSLVAIGGTCTATSIIGQATGVDNGGATATTSARFTALASAASFSNSFDCITIDGLIVVNAAGNLTVQYAIADVPESGAGSVLPNGTFEVKRVS